MITRGRRCRTVNPSSSQLCLESGERVSTATYTPTRAVSATTAISPTASPQSTVSVTGARQRLTGSLHGFAGVMAVTAVLIGRIALYVPAIVSTFLTDLVYGVLVPWVFYSGISIMHRRLGILSGVLGNGTWVNAATLTSDHEIYEYHEYWCILYWQDNLVLGAGRSAWMVAIVGIPLGYWLQPSKACTLDSFQYHCPACITDCGAPWYTACKSEVFVRTSFCGAHLSCLK